MVDTNSIWNSTVEQKKALKTNGFQGFDGGDKRIRTAALFHAIASKVPDSADLYTLKGPSKKSVCI